MRRFLMSVSVVAMALAVAGNAQAGPRVASVGVSRTVTTTRSNVYYPVTKTPTTYVTTGVVTSNYLTTYGTKFSYGYLYKGLNHRHWTYTLWSAQYNTTLFYDPFLRCYFYWCQPARCYYPLSYINVAPPVVTFASPSMTIVAPAVIAANAAANEANPTQNPPVP